METIRQSGAQPAQARLQPQPTHRPKVYVTRVIPEATLELLRASCDVSVWPGELPPPYETLKREARDAEGILCLLTDRIDAALLDACPRLRVVSNLAVGYDNIDVAAATTRGILVGNTPGMLDETTADFAFALLLAAARRIVEGVDNVRTGGWRTWGPLTLLGADIHHATLGVIGLGRIGARVAQRARGFEMRVLYATPMRRPAHQELEARLGLTYASLDDLFAQADFVSIHAPLNEQTRGLFNRQRLRQMKRSAILINTARGPIVETDALVAALQADEIAGAALDVTDPEPLPEAHPLLAAPNCIVTPHIASATYATRGQMADLAARNLLAGLAGQPLPAAVNYEAIASLRSQG
ncbi:MAG TPA: D-glycerate dehydrogenase [Ktedonobacterales bacterium]|nr:D-glycerate dehydrogenase [Ktedonobacterales bacterium]